MSVRTYAVVMVSSIIISNIVEDSFQGCSNHYHHMCLGQFGHWVLDPLLFFLQSGISHRSGAAAMVTKSSKFGRFEVFSLEDIWNILGSFGWFLRSERFCACWAFCTCSFEHDWERLAKGLIIHFDWLDGFYLISGYSGGAWGTGLGLF